MAWNRSRFYFKKKTSFKPKTELTLEERIAKAEKQVELVKQGIKIPEDKEELRKERERQRYHNLSPEDKTKYIQRVVERKKNLGLKTEFKDLTIETDAPEIKSIVNTTKDKKNEFKQAPQPNPTSNLKSILDLKVPEYRREMFEKWVGLLDDKYIWTAEDEKNYPGFGYKAGDKIDYATKNYITSRGTGKTKNTTLRVIFRVYKETYNDPNKKDYSACLLMRNWDEHLVLSKNYYEGVLTEFCDFAFGHDAEEERMKWSIREKERKNWRSYYRAIEYQGQERVLFFNLFHPAESKRTNNPLTEVFYEEAIPTKEQRSKKLLTTKGWIPNEETNFSIIFKSADRNTGTTTKTFLGNPTVPWLEIWFLVKYWFEELKEFNEWYWKERKKYSTLEKWMEWSWIKTWKKVIPGIGPILLYLEKNVHVIDEFSSEDNFNWDAFAEKLEKFNLLEKFIRGSDYQYMYQNCICYYAKQGFYFFIHKDDPEISNKDEIENIPERYTNYEQYFASEQKYKEPIDGQVLLNEIKDWWDQGILKFKGLVARDIIMEFAIKQPVRIGNPFSKLKQAA